MPTDNTYGKQTLLSGTRQDIVLTTPTVGVVGDISQKALAVNSGERFGVAIGAALSNAAAVLTKDYAINLISLVGHQWFHQNQHLLMLSSFQKY